MRRQVSSTLTLCAVLGASGAFAQFADWSTVGFDAQRSHWLRSDTKISLASMRKPGFELVWKNNVNEGRAPQQLTPPVLLDFYISYRGFRSLAFVGGAGNSVVAYDADLGRAEWKKDLKADTGGAKAASAMCPGGMTSTVTRPAVVGYPPPAGSGGTGRGTPAKSGVGEPMEGAVTLRRDPPRPPAQLSSQAKPAANSARRVAIPESPYAPRVQLVHALSSDGKLHSMYVSNGEEPKPAVQFIPANSYAKGLIVLDNVAYVATVNGCGGTENGVWALDLKTDKVTHWKANASLAGSVGFAAGADGTIYATAGSELTALQDRTLERKASFNIGKQVFTSSPLIADFNGKDLIAAMANDGKLYIFDAAAPGAPIASTAAFSSAPITAGAALASWADSAGTRWILAPAGQGAIVAWKVVERNGAVAVEPGWTSREIPAPRSPIVVNGVVFALASGATARPGAAVLYALDSGTGKELWNSGKTITSHVTAEGLTAGGSRVYVVAQDGTQYVFGFPMEH